MKIPGKKHSPASLALAAGMGLLSLVLGESCSPLTDYKDRVVRLTVKIEGDGTVAGIPGGDSILLAGSRLKLTAVPGNGMLFIAWRAPSLTTSLNPLDIRIDHDMTIRACFGAPPEGLAPISAKDSGFPMGSSNPLGSESESPVHTVRFRHDFYIGRHEVTQGEYKALIGAIPKVPGALDIGDSFPVYTVTWYDAALYCNRLSRQQGYDTVYSYSAFCQDPACPWILENLETHYDRFGYRLPTEAEWEFACRAGAPTDYYWGSGAEAEKAAKEYAWYYVNSHDQAQPVARLLPNAFGLFDMAGNCAEWVGDWLGCYPDTALIDPVGPSGLSQRHYEQTHERPVRGGSWRLGTAFLRSSCRKGPYPTSAFVVMKDIGFRVALGAFRPDTIAQPPKAGDSLPVALACKPNDLYSFIGTLRIKLAFAIKQGGRRELAFFDFSTGTRARRCGNDASVYCPSISPDGRFAAYSSKGEGFAGSCTLTIRALDTNGSNPVRTNGYIPRFWVSDAPRDTFVIYTSGTSPSGNNPRWYTEQTFKRPFRGGTLADDIQVLWNAGSYHGGLSSDGRFLGTSYQLAKVVDLQINDTFLYYFAKPYNGRPEDHDNWTQVCNLSMSPSLAEPGEALLLDFGYPHISTLLGKSYGMHAVMFICNTRLVEQAHVSQWFEKPTGYDQWDDTEFSNHAGFIVAVARVAGAEDALYIVRRKDSSYLKVATGRNLSHPALWIDPLQVSQVNDPYRWFGAYDIPQQWNGQVVLGRKLRLFWHYRQSAECIAIGSSPMYYGFDPTVISMPTLNIASLGADIISDITILKEYVLAHAPRLKAIILDLMPGFFDRRTRPVLLGLYDSKGYELDARKNFYKSGIPPQVESRINAFSKNDWLKLNASGFEENPWEGTGWGQPIIDKGDYDLNDSVVRLTFSLLEDLADTVAARGVHLCIVSFPEHPGYASTPVIGRYGPSRETYGRVVSRIEEIAQNNRFVHFYDANNYGKHDYSDTEAYDCNHMNFRGGRKIAARVDSLLKIYTR